MIGFDSPAALSDFCGYLSFISIFAKLTHA